MLSRPNGRWTESSEEMIQHLLKVHFPECQLGDWQLILAPSHRGLSGYPLQTVTEDRINWTIRTMDPFKSTGEDGIFPALLQKGL